jgi:energy-coupling factor transporter ATP-binding protein EcfA2
VESELAFAPENLCLSTDEIKKRIDDSLKLLNISHLKNQKTHSLSYGQKKLVALSSLITLSPYIFLLDEPLSGLSFEYKKTVIELIKYLSEKQKIIFVSSHSNEIKNVSNKAIIL